MKREQKSTLKREKILLLLVIGLALAIGVLGGIDFNSFTNKSTTPSTTVGFRP